MEIAQRNDQLGQFNDVTDIPMYGMLKVLPPSNSFNCHIENSRPWVSITVYKRQF